MEEPRGVTVLQKPTTLTAVPIIKMRKEAEADRYSDWDISFSFTSRCQFNSRALTQYFLMIISSRKRRKSLLGKAAMMSATSSETCTVLCLCNFGFSFSLDWLVICRQF